MTSLINVTNMKLLLTDQSQTKVKKSLLATGKQVPRVTDIDGLTLKYIDIIENMDTSAEEHRNKVVRAEAIVIRSPDYRRTKSAFESQGIMEINIRDDIYPGIRLSFFQAGTADNGLIIELVTPLEAG